MSHNAQERFFRGAMVGLVAACLLGASQGTWCAGEEKAAETPPEKPPEKQTIFKGIDEAYYKALCEEIASAKKRIPVLEAMTKRTKDESKELKELSKELPKKEELKAVIEKKKSGAELTRNELEALKGASLMKGRGESRQRMAASLGPDGRVDYTRGLGPEGGWNSAKLFSGPVPIDLGYGSRTINLGSLGVRVYLPLEQPRLQCLVDWVEVGSPADGKPNSEAKHLTSKSGVPIPEPVLDGKLIKHDVILGVISPKVDGLDKDGNFCAEANHVFSKVVEEAEKVENGGTIVLKVWRPKTKSTTRTIEIVPAATAAPKEPTPPAADGPPGDAAPSEKEKTEVAAAPEVEPAKPAEGGEREVFTVPDLQVVQPVSGEVINVTVTVPVLGSYSETSPWNCPKTDKLIDIAAQSIMKSEEFGSSFGAIIAALGLLATGEEQYLPKVREFAHTLIEDGEKHNHERLDDGADTWHTAYRLVLLGEYYLITKDEAVLPAIQGYALVMSKGISGVGNWGHGTAPIKENGLYGPAYGYGAMSQASLPTTIGLVLAQKCGIKNHYVDKAVDLALSFYPYYVDKGVIPYGDGIAQRDSKHDSNGKNSIAAVLYDMAGRKREAEYFTRMTLMSHAEREGGHTGDYFAWTWGALGAARGGPAAANMFCRNTRYWTELGRRFDGNSTYQPVLKGDPGKYKGWCTTGAMLLQYCLPRKALYITGKGSSVVTPIVGDELKMLEDAGRLSKEVISKASDDRLLEYLHHYSPLIRERAGLEMGNRNKNVVDTLLKMLKSDNRYARYGACQGLRYTGKMSPTPVYDALVSIIETDDDWILRHYAATAMDVPDSPKDKTPGLLGLPPFTYAERLLKVASGIDAKKDQEMRRIQGEVAALLFGKGGALCGAENLGKIDHPLLVSTLKKFMLNPGGSVRVYAASTMQFLSKEDMEQLWGPLYYGMTHAAISGSSEGINMTGNGLMAEYHIKEGLPLVIHWIFERQGWGNKARKANSARVTSYGMLLEPYFKELEKWTFVDGVQEALEKLKATPAPKLVSIEDRIKAFEAELAREK